MKNNNFIFSFLIILVFNACTGNFDELGKNPNSPEEVTPGLLFTSASLNIASPSYGKTLFNHPMLVKQVVWTETIESYQYNFFDRAGFGTYSSIRNVVKMMEEAERTNEDVYIGLGHFLKAWHFYSLTMTFGDVPYSEASLGETDGLFDPIYDTQEDVFIGVLDNLEKANTILANTNGVINGDVLSWRKAVNSFSLKVLISLSKKAGNSTINIAQKFAKIINDPSTYPIFTSNDDNLQLDFSDVGGERYPFWNTTHAQYPHMDEFITELLKRNEDRRLFFFAAPTQQALIGGLQTDDFDAYVGADGTSDFNDIVAQEASKNLSRIHSRYYENFDAEPYVTASYWELQFNIAEAAQRGWITNNAADYYNEGIRANIQFYRNNAISYDNVSVNDSYINDYISSANVLYNPSNGIEQILTQKYIASFINSEYTVYYDYRRTGFPDLPINPSTSLNVGSENKIPTRWRYPQSELNYNTVNVEEAIKRQYSEDNVNSLMWILK